MADQENPRSGARPGLGSGKRVDGDEADKTHPLPISGRGPAPSAMADQTLDAYFEEMLSIHYVKAASHTSQQVREYKEEGELGRWSDNKVSEEIPQTLPDTESQAQAERQEGE